MKQIYMNYAATSPGTSPLVTEVLTTYLSDHLHLNAGRNFEGIADRGIALRARKAIAELFGATHVDNVIFTSGATLSLNMLIGGILRAGDHVIAGGLEHNAVARPLKLLHKNGVIDIDYLPHAQDGSLDPLVIHSMIRPNTRLLILSHASNVIGTILPVKDCFAIAKSHGIMTVLDAAQTAGCIPVTLNEHTDAIAFAGHKGLRGLAGIGGFVLGDDAGGHIKPWLTGGTGSASKQLDQPEFLPDKFEAGTQNTLGILSLSESVTEINRIGVEKIREKEEALTKRFLSKCRNISNLNVHGTGDAALSVAVVSVSCPDIDSNMLAQQLYEEYGIITRSGLHCAPLAHKTAGTYPEGTVRFSFGYDTTIEEIDFAGDALERILSAHVSV